MVLLSQSSAEHADHESLNTSSSLPSFLLFLHILPTNTHPQPHPRPKQTSNEDSSTRILNITIKPTSIQPQNLKMSRYGASARDRNSYDYDSCSPRQGDQREPDEYDRIFGNRGPRDERGNSRRERTTRGSNLQPNTDSAIRPYTNPAYRGPASHRAAHPPSSDDESDYAPSGRAAGGARASGPHRHQPSADAELEQARRWARIERNERRWARNERNAGWGVGGSPETGRVVPYEYSTDDESDVDPRSTRGHRAAPGAGREQQRHRPALNDGADGETRFARLEREIEGRRPGGPGSRGGMPAPGPFRGGSSMGEVEDMEDIGRGERRGAVSGGRPRGH